MFLLLHRVTQAGSNIEVWALQMLRISRGDGARQLGLKPVTQQHRCDLNACQNSLDVELRLVRERYADS